jgi:hypothetical protein
MERGRAIFNWTSMISLSNPPKRVNEVPFAEKVLPALSNRSLLAIILIQFGLLTDDAIGKNCYITTKTE